MTYGRPLVGFGGFGALSSTALGPDVETGLQNALVVVDDLHDQVFADLNTLTDQGVDVGEYRATADAIAMEKGVLWGEISQASASEVPDLQARILDLQDRTRALHTHLLQLRRGAPEQQQLTGLLWGLGAVAAAGAVAWFVWDQRRKRRR